jgi:hypothetical protein
VKQENDMTELQLKEFLEENKADIQAAVKKKAIEELLTTYRWDIGEQISKAVNEFVATEIIPAVKSELTSQQGAIAEAAIKAIAGIADELAKGFVETAAKNIGSDYKRREIAKAIFGY